MSHQAWRPPARSGASPIASRARRRVTLLLVGATVLPGSCGGGPPGRIVYPYPWLHAALARLAQQTIDGWGRPRAAEIPESLMARVAPAPGYAGDIGYAEAMAALPGVVAAVGPQSSRATLLVAPLFAERGIPLISATASSRRLRALGRAVFQLAPDDEAEGAFIATFVLDRLAARRVTIFYLDADEYGLGLRDGLVEALRGRGVAPVDQVGIIESTDLPRRVAESLRRATPQVVVVAARAPEALAITRAVHERLPRARVVAGDGVPLNAAFVRSTGAAASVVYAVAWWHPDLPDTLSRAFAVQYERVGGAPPSPAEAMFYDAIMVAAQAVREVGPRRAAIRRYLGELGISRPPYRGVTGPISFAPRRPVNLLMTHVVNGATAMVGPSDHP